MDDVLANTHNEAKFAFRDQGRWDELRDLFHPRASIAVMRQFSSSDRSKTRPAIIGKCPVDPQAFRSFFWLFETQFDVGLIVQPPVP